MRLRELPCSEVSAASAMLQGFRSFGQRVKKCRKNFVQHRYLSPPPRNCHLTDFPIWVPDIIHNTGADEVTNHSNEELGVYVSDSVVAAS